MKRKCADKQCGKKFVSSRADFKLKRAIACEKGDENLCNACFKDVQEIAYGQSYFGSISEWGV
jgi:hypothetical protein